MIPVLMNQAMPLFADLDALSQVDISTSKARDPMLSTFQDLRGRIAIFGGSFDPLQSAHLRVAEKALDKYELDMVVFMPTAANPLKQNKPIGTNDQRVEMIKLAIQDNPRLFVSELDYTLPQPAYSCNLMAIIKEQVDESASLFFMVGSDCAKDFEKWIGFDKLEKLTEFIVVDREEGTESSTEVRAQIKAGDIATLRVPRAVKSYLLENRIYV